jgi:excinuclease UvrABC ATPase subunit
VTFASSYYLRSFAEESLQASRDVIEHHQVVMAHADWIIDLGPSAGHDGGRIVFERTPVDLVTARSTLTGEHLAAYARD